MASDILVVDDEADIRELVAGILEDEGHDTRIAGDADEALQAIRSRKPTLVFLDIWLQGSRLDGLELLDELRKEYPDLAVVMISGHGNIETAVSAIRRGAYDFIEKPFKADRLLHVASKAIENSSLKKQVKDLQERTGDTSDLLGKSPAVQQLRQVIERAAPSNARILISGQSGSGKEMVARMIHKNSHRKDGPFVILNAANITPDSMEIELFGTQSSQEGGTRKVGALEEAHLGTLYLDEIADMPPDTQSRILRVLVEQKFTRVGGTQPVKVDVRIISSSARDLEGLIASGRFREDLFHRLAVVPVRVPPLAERREDIPELVDVLMDQIGRQSGIENCSIGDDAMAVLTAHDWPGNVRQLRNNIERLMILAKFDEGTVISADMLPQEVGELLPATGGSDGEHLISLPLKEAREAFEREYLAAQVGRFSGNISRTAEFIGMERSALHRKLKTLGVLDRRNNIRAQDKQAAQ